MMKQYWILRAFRILLFLGIAAAGLGYAVMVLWNVTLPAVTGYHAITFGQALALLVLARILFGGLRGRGSHGWRSRMHRRWQEMTPEEREQVRTRMPCGMTRRHRDAAPPAPQS
jgi:hypothetical protein